MIKKGVSLAFILSLTMAGQALAANGTGGNAGGTTGDTNAGGTTSHETGPGSAGRNAVIGGDGRTYGNTLTGNVYRDRTSNRGDRGNMNANVPGNSNSTGGLSSRGTEMGGNTATGNTLTGR